MDRSCVFVLGMCVAAVAMGAPHEPKPAQISEIVLSSPNGRYETRFKCTDDGSYFSQVDTVTGRIVTSSVTTDDGAIIGIGEEQFVKKGAYRAAIKSDTGFTEWGRAIEVP